MRYRCTDHPRYEGKRQPTGNCIACWWVFFFGDQKQDWWSKVQAKIRF